MKRLLVQTQLSNYDTKGKFILECDSGWNMVMGRVREMLKLNPELDITVMGPLTGEDSRTRQLITDPWDVHTDLWERYGDEGENRLHYFEHNIIPNALVTRYDFDWTGLACGLDLGMQKIGQAPKYDAVYINDPMHLRNFQAMFYVVGGYQPKFFVHSHFIDNPECPKFPKEASLWLGQCEAAIKADFNFWQCESAMHVFFNSMKSWFTEGLVDQVVEKSLPWDDGFSASEITSPVDMNNVRFDIDKFRSDTWGKIVLFVPNRIGGRGRSSDYTNCGKFMFDILPELHKRRNDYVVVAGNPSQKFLNSELKAECGPNGYLNLVPDALNRDEFKYVTANSHVAVGLYDQDAYGGTAARECIELGLLPLWLDNYEYSSLAREAGYGGYLARPDFSDLVTKTDELLTNIRARDPALFALQKRLHRVVRERCSYEATTSGAMRRMGLL